MGAAESGLPRAHGFDYFFGYLNQHHVHNHFPEFLWRNEDELPLPNEVVPVGDHGGGYAGMPCFTPMIFLPMKPSNSLPVIPRNLSFFIGAR